MLTIRLPTAAASFTARPKPMSVTQLAFPGQRELWRAIYQETDRLRSTMQRDRGSQPGAVRRWREGH